MKQGFEKAVAMLVERYPEYPEEAYEFMRTGLDAAADRFCKDDKSPHLSAKEVYLGACAYALEEYGPMAADVLGFWGIHSASDFGNIVYNLIEVGIFGKQKEDKREQFDELPDLQSFLNAPYDGTYDGPLSELPNF
ncbi:MAG: hypothetical protein IKZ07_04540 [Akkermansia sp.]|nr:hypothetical protein [Akkermansia sp.]